MPYREVDLEESEYKLENSKEINLSRGDLNFQTPDVVIEEAYNAMKRGYTHYIYRYGSPPYCGSQRGLPELREAACSYYGKYNPSYTPDEVLVTSGSGTALNLIFNAFLKTNDEVVLTDPTYAGYFKDLEYIKINKRYVPLVEDEHWKLDVDALEKVVSSKTRMMVLCNPLNPTGKVFDEKELNAIASLATKYDFSVLADEIYNEYTWNGKRHHSISSIDGMKDRTIVVQSFSKTFAMTGWRLGYILAPKNILDKVVNTPLSYTAATFIQKAGAAGLRNLYSYDAWGAPSHIELWRRELYRRLKFFHEELTKIKGVECQFPDATFYLWPKLNLSVSTNKFIKALEEKKVFVDPGPKYGPSGENHIRFGMTQPFYYLEEAIERIKLTVDALL